MERHGNANLTDLQQALADFLKARISYLALDNSAC
jgi:hypothetical protein